MPTDPTTTTRYPQTRLAPLPELDPSDPRRRHLGPYRLDRELGRGGMGVVYLGYDLTLRRRVAIKVMQRRPGRRPDLRRWRIETWAAARLEHPMIVRVLHAGVADGVHYCAMELVEGESLAQRLARGPLSQRAAAELLQGLAGAVAHAHDLGVIHRDIKPGNVMLERGGRPRLTDFGLARLKDDPLRMTQSGELLGTLAYMAPEQLRGDRESDERADLYALGSLLYELLVGRPPCIKGRLAAVGRGTGGAVRPPRELSPAVCPQLERICLQLLAFDPSDRYADARALADDLRRWLAGQPVEAGGRRPLVALALEGLRRRGRALAAAGLALITLAGLSHARSRDLQRAQFARERTRLAATVRGATEALREGRPAAALSSLGPLSAAPEHGVLVGRALLACGDPGAARTALRRGLRLTPRDREGWIALARVEQRLGALAPAADAWRQAAACGAKPRQTQPPLAALLLAWGRPGQALTALASLGDRDAAVQGLRAAATLAARRPWRELQRALDAARAAGAAPAQCDRWRARGLARAGRTHDALIVLGAALRARPSDLAARRLRAQLQLSLGAGEEAALDLDALTEAGQPEQPALRARALLWSGQPEAALTRLSQPERRTLRPSRAEPYAVHDSRAEPHALRGRDDRDALIARARLVSGLVPDRAALPPIERALADALADPRGSLRRLLGANDAAEPSSMTDPPEPGPERWLRRAAEALDRSQAKRADALLRVALVRHPRSPEAWLALVRARRKQGRLPEASARCDQLADALPERRDIAQLRAELALERRAPRAARAALARWRARPTTPELRLLARAASLAGDLDAALALSRRWMVAAPDSVEVHRVRERTLRARSELIGAAARPARALASGAAALLCAWRARPQRATAGAAARARLAAIGRRERRWALLLEAARSRSAAGLRAASMLVALRPEDARGWTMRALWRLRQLDPVAIGDAARDACEAIERDPAARLALERRIGGALLLMPESLLASLLERLEGQLARSPAALALAADLRALRAAASDDPAEIERALAGFDRALASRPFSGARWARARLLLALARPREAAADLAWLERHWRRRWDVLLLRAAEAQLLRRHDRAREFLRQAALGGMPPEARLLAPGPLRRWMAREAMARSDR